MFVFVSVCVLVLAFEYAFVLAQIPYGLLCVCFGVFLCVIVFALF